MKICGQYENLWSIYLCQSMQTGLAGVGIPVAAGGSGLAPAGSCRRRQRSVANHMSTDGPNSGFSRVNLLWELLFANRGAAVLAMFW